MRFLKGIVIQNTTRCNARCTVCPHSQVYKDRYDMSDEVWERILRSIRSMDYKGYAGFLLHCEPLMDKKILKRIEDLKNLGQGIQVGIMTNASLLGTEMVNELRRLKIDHIAMSLLSADRDEYENITGLNYQSVTENIIKALPMFDSSRIHAVINASVGSAKEKGKYLRAFPGLSERITFNTRDSRAGFFDNMKSNYEEWCLKCVNRSRAVCDQPFFYLPVFADGSVRFCSADWTGESCMGNVKDSTIQEIFYSEKMAYSAGRMAGLQFDYDFCRNCYSEIGLGT